MDSLRAFLAPLVSSSCCTGIHDGFDLWSSKSNNSSRNIKKRRRKPMSPEEYAKMILAMTDDDYADIPKLSESLASEISNFNCAHLVAALEYVPQWDRTEMVRNVLVHCVDLEQNHCQIQRHLTEWERSLTDRAFKRALEQQQEQRGPIF